VKESLILRKARRAYDKGHYKEAERYLNKSLQQHRDPKEDVLYLLGLCAVRLENWDDAVQHLRALLGFHHSIQRDRQIRKVLGFVYAQKKQFDIAESIFKAVLALDFNDPQSCSALGFCQFQQGNHEAAIESLKKALKLDALNANALNSLGYIYTELDRNIEWAIKAVSKAMEQSPDNPAYLDSLGWAFFKKGDMKTARDYLTRALEHLPDNTELKGHLKEIIVQQIRSKKDVID